MLFYILFASVLEFHLTYLAQNLLGGGDCSNSVSIGPWSGQKSSLTVEASVIGLNESLLDLSVLNKQDVALAAVVTKDSGAIEAEVKGLGELAGGVAQEANLTKQTYQSKPIAYRKRPSGIHLHRSCPGGPGSQPKPWSCCKTSINTPPNTRLCEAIPQL